MSSILYLSPYFWPEEIGSAPYCTELAIWLRENGHKVDVIAFRPHYPDISQYSLWLDGSRDSDCLDGMSIQRAAVVGRGKGGFRDRLHNDLSFLWLVIKRLAFGRLRQVDAIVAFVPSILTLYGAFAVRLLTGARIVAVIHDVESGLAKSLNVVNSRALISIMRRVERVGLNCADHVVVLTEEMGNELRNLGCRRPISTLPIWVSVHAAKPYCESEHPVVMYSGNFGKKQNLDQLLPLIKRLSDERHRISIILRGDGSEKERLKAKLTEAKVTNTQFLPLVPAEEFIVSLQSASLHIVPQALNVSNYAVPSKLFSIMSAGRPFVSIAEKGSPIDQLAQKSGAGVCVRPGDEEALYRAIIDLSSDASRLTIMGEGGRKFVGQHMDRATILRSYGALILELNNQP